MPTQISHPRVRTSHPERSEGSQTNLLLTHKPSGVSTHRPAEDKPGFVEWLCQKNKERLFVCQRLDKDTSGAMVFAKSKDAAARLTDLFSNQQVEKEYWLISDKKSSEEEWVVKTEEKKGRRPEPRKGMTEVAQDDKGGFGVQAETRFARCQSLGPFTLYKAFPKTGKTHQIRIHAIQSGIPILGDELYEGSPFPRLMLHCYSLKFLWEGKEVVWQSHPSRLFTDLELLSSHQLASWVNAVERREVLWPEEFNNEQCMRLLHKESGDLRIDQAGPVWVMGWWQPQEPDASAKANLRKLVRIFQPKHWILQSRPGVNQDNQLSTSLQSESLPEESWGFLEGEAKFVGTLQKGQNFGLFLDQRERRQWVRENSQKRVVLNLFSFTCGFSLQAALGKASKVVSVDSFKKYLEWGKENFRANDLDPDSESYEFRAMDVRDYLSWAQKKQLSFDLIVCDPPSFSRGRKASQSFRVEKDYKELIEDCWRCLAPGGTLLFSTNYEKWDLSKWQQRLDELELGEPSVSPSQWDYEWNTGEANLKAFFLRKLAP